MVCDVGEKETHPRPRNGETRRLKERNSMMI
jgi:hypothetical protein